MLKRRIRAFAIAGITIAAAAALVTLGATGASATTTTASASGHVTASLTAHAAVAPSGCVTETFTTADERYYEPCVADAQILLNDLWYYDQAHSGVYLGADRLLTVDGSYGLNTAGDVVSFQTHWSLEIDGKLGKQTWATLCYSDALHGYNGAYYKAAGCPSVFGL